MLCSDPRYTPVITQDSDELPTKSMQGKWPVCTECCLVEYEKVKISLLTVSKAKMNIILRMRNSRIV